MADEAFMPNQPSMEIILRAEDYVKRQLITDSSGHDWWHIARVTKLALKIAEAEGADVFVCELAALLHDIADEKLNASKEEGLRKVSDWLQVQQVAPETASHVMEIISTMSYSGGHNKPMTTLEGRVVQDADRLDALGAVGIARTFAYAGWKGQCMHDPDIRPRERMTREEYRNEPGTAVNHFYEKLLKLKYTMNTEYAVRLAERRHLFMERFLEQFYAEWEADDDRCLLEHNGEEEGW